MRLQIWPRRSMMLMLPRSWPSDSGANAPNCTVDYTSWPMGDGWRAVARKIFLRVGIGWVL